MNCWDILGITPTRDPDIIKKAFSALSKKHHPEIDPEGFMQLREAYRFAIHLTASLSEIDSAPSHEEPTKEPTKETKQQPIILSTLVNEETSQHFEELSPVPTVQIDIPTLQQENYSYLYHEIPEPIDFNPAWGQTNQQKLRLRDSLLRKIVSKLVDAQRKPVPDYFYFKQPESLPLRDRAKVVMKLVWNTNVFRVFVVLLLALSLLAIKISSAISYANANDKASVPGEYVNLTLADYNLSYTQVKKLMSDARTILKTETDYRKDVIDRIKENAAFYQCSSAIHLEMNEIDYPDLVSIYKKQGEAELARQLENYRCEEYNFTLTEVLPVIKHAIIDQQYTPIIIDISSMVGIAQTEFMTISRNYKEANYNTYSLDRNLKQYIRLISPDKWIITNNDT